MKLASIWGPITTVNFMINAVGGAGRRNRMGSVDDLLAEYQRAEGLAGEDMSGVGDQRSEVRSQKSEVRAYGNDYDRLRSVVHPVLSTEYPVLMQPAWITPGLVCRPPTSDL